jgi:predicted TPR repeat methyltransferase
MTTLHSPSELEPSADLAVARAAVLAARPGDREHEANRRRILQFLDEHPDALHRSCAEGHLTERLVRKADAVTAVDISSVALARARRRAPSARFREADLMTWEPAPGEGPFDAVVLAEVLYYLDRPVVRREFEAMFPRIVSWLKPRST